MSKAIAQYLSTYAEPESRALGDFPAIRAGGLLVVPCYREKPAFLERLDCGLMRRENVLTLVVINQPPGPPEPRNLELLTFFRGLQILWQNANLTLYRAVLGESCWLVVDRFTAERCIDPRHGVGLARKIGCDLAAALINLGRCRGPWIHTSDADAHLPDNYFAPLPDRGSSAAVFATHHRAAPDTDAAVLAATRLYEQALDYYVRGLRWAGSPYGFPTIGSAMAVHLQAYCAARGFPKRAGGEDFYLLNKLAKLGRVECVDAVCVAIEARRSDRVPFGTGPAVAKILALGDPRDFTYYAPAVFSALKSWLVRLPQTWQALQSGGDPLAGLAPEVAAALAAAGVDRLWSHLLQQADSPAQGATAAHHWFDGFRTLKFIRYLQDTTFPAAPLLHALGTAEFMGNSSV